MSKAVLISIRPEYHQNARATKLHYTPDTRPGALV